MLKRRCLSVLAHQGRSLLSLNMSTHCPGTVFHLHTPASDPSVLENLTSNLHYSCHSLESLHCFPPKSICHFSSQGGNFRRHDDEDDSDRNVDEVDDEEMEENSEMDSDGDHSVSNSNIHRAYSMEKKEDEAAAIGYKVIGPLDPSERPFKYYEPVFAVVQVGSHQFKVSNGDTIYTERLKFCEVNDKLILNRVLMLGSKSQTIVGRPILPDTAVHAVVEEHALDAKVIIFKKKRRKNYRRTKGHRQELTRLRITDIIGIEKPEDAAIRKPEKVAVGV